MGGLRRGELDAAAAAVHGAFEVARGLGYRGLGQAGRARLWFGSWTAACLCLVEGDGSEWSEWDCFQESRTRAPSRLSRMWTTLLARLGEISIVLHAGVVRAERQEDDDVGQLRLATTQR
jgi:hypothetical protein